MSQSIYNIARVAQAKLSNEAGSQDHNLHRLIAHAKLYDKILIACYDDDNHDTKTAPESPTGEKGPALVPSTGSTDFGSRKEDPFADSPCYEVAISGDYPEIAVEAVEVGEDDG
jgi:hypothetical protein